MCSCWTGLLADPLMKNTPQRCRMMISQCALLYKYIKIIKTYTSEQVETKTFRSHLSIRPPVAAMTAALRSTGPCWSTGCLAAAAPSGLLFLSVAGKWSWGSVWNGDCMFLSGSKRERGSHHLGAYSATSCTMLKSKWLSADDILMRLYTSLINTCNSAVLFHRKWLHVKKLLKYLLACHERNMSVPSGDHCIDLTH